MADNGNANESSGTGTQQPQQQQEQQLQPTAMSSSTTEKAGHTISANKNSDDDVISSPEALQRIKDDQAALIDSLQRQLNESQVKYGEQIYWLRLELDSSRREKEAAEDRLSELYRGVQDLLTSGDSDLDDSTQNHLSFSADHHDTDGGTAAAAAESSTNSKDAGGGICTEPDYVRALQERLSSYQASVEILNRQITMMKTSSDVVVSSMKQEVTDLVEEKSLMELDLLNQISNLDNAKRHLEYQLLAVNEGVEAQENLEGGEARTVNVPPQTSSPASTDVQPAVATVGSGVDVTSPPTDFDEAGIESLTVSHDSNSTREEDGLSIINAPPTAAPAKGQEVSLDTTATTLVQDRSSLAHDVATSAVLIPDASNESPQEQPGLTQSLLEEVARWKEEAEAMNVANARLRKQVEEITKDLILTRNSGKVALALDRIETDRAETVAHLDRITVLWDRADRTIQVMEGLLAEFEPVTGSSKECQDPNQTDLERLLSTLETATLVHGQIKMSLMLIELTFRNHLACIQNDNLQELQNVRASDKLEQVRIDTLSALEKAETKWTVAVEQVEKQILTDTQSTNDSLRLQLGQLQQAQDKQKLLEREMQAMKAQPDLPESTESTVMSPNSAPANFNPGGGLVVSRNVMLRLQKEILSVVDAVQQKNEAIQLLMATIDKYRLREEVLQRELKRATLKTQKKPKTKKDGNTTGQKKPFDLAKPTTAEIQGVANHDSNASSRGKNRHSKSNAFHELAQPSEYQIFKGEPSSPASHTPTRQKPPKTHNRCWSSL